MPHAVIGNFMGEPFHKFWTLRPGPDKCHVALEHTPELRDFIKPRNTEKFPNLGNPRIVVVGPCGSDICFSILAHGAKFVAIEYLSSQTNALLMVEHRSVRVDFNDSHNKGNQRSCKQKDAQTDGAIQQPPQ